MSENKLPLPVIKIADSDKNKPSGERTLDISKEENSGDKTPEYIYLYKDDELYKKVKYTSESDSEPEETTTITLSDIPSNLFTLTPIYGTFKKYKIILDESKIPTDWPKSTDDDSSKDISFDLSIGNTTIFKSKKDLVTGIIIEDEADFSSIFGTDCTNIQSSVSKNQTFSYTLYIYLNASIFNTTQTIYETGRGRIYTLVNYEKVDNIVEPTQIKIDLSKNNGTVAFKLVTLATNKLSINWGDGSSETTDPSISAQTTIHYYDTNDNNDNIFNISISGGDFRLYSEQMSTRVTEIIQGSEQKYLYSYEISNFAKNLTKFKIGKNIDRFQPTGTYENPFCDYDSNLVIDTSSNSKFSYLELTNSGKNNGKILYRISDGSKELVGYLPDSATSTELDLSNTGATLIYSWAFYNKNDSARAYTSLKLPAELTYISTQAFVRYKIKGLYINTNGKYTTYAKNAFLNTVINNTYFNGSLQDWVKKTFENEYANPIANIKKSIEDDTAYTDKKLYLAGRLVSLDLFKDLLSNIDIKPYNFYSYKFDDNEQPVELPQRRIGEYAFCKTNISSIQFKNLTNGLIIGSCAFRECSELNKISIDTSLQGNISFGNHSFYDCTNLNANIISSSNSRRNITFGNSCFENCYNNSSTNPNKINFELSGKFTSNDKITINNNAFANSGIESFKFSIAPEITIGNNAFYNCTKLTNFSYIKNQGVNTDIPNIKSIGNRAFSGCTSLNNLHIEDIFSKTTEIGEEAFYNTAIFNESKTLDLSNKNLTSIGKNAFANIKTSSMKKLSTVSINNSILQNFKNIFSNDLYTSYLICENTISVPEMAFDGFKNIEDIELINNNTSINDGYFQKFEGLAFQGCENLINLTVDYKNHTKNLQIFASLINGCPNLKYALLNLGDSETILVDILGTDTPQLNDDSGLDLTLIFDSKIPDNFFSGIKNLENVKGKINIEFDSYGVSPPSYNLQKFKADLASLSTNDKTKIGTIKVRSLEIL